MSNKIKHSIKVCTACSCTKRFAEDSLAAAANELGINVGETTEEHGIKLEKTGCLSHCEKGPNVLFTRFDEASGEALDGEVKTGMLPSKLVAEIKQLN